MSSLIEMGYDWRDVEVTNDYDVLNPPERITTSTKICVKCRKCSKIVEVKVEKLLKGQKPCACGRNYYKTHERKCEKLLPLLDHCNYSFDGTYLRSAHTPFKLTCGKCETSWRTCYAAFVNAGRRCPGCARQYRRDEEEFLHDLGEVGNDLGFSVVSLPSSPRTTDKVLLACDKCNHQWEANISNTLSRRYGCPNCSKTGFNPVKPAYIYLMSIESDGLLLAYKFGISNLPKKRLENIRTAAGKTLDISLIYKHKFKYGRDCKDLENVLKGAIPSPVLGKNLLPDGYTETFPADKINEVRCLIQDYISRHGGVQAGGSSTGGPQ